jgi:CheY-like chemotaxis protein
MRVLIAEDNNMNVFILNQFLKKWGADVTVVENGKLALDKLQEEHYDIVLMDYHMPVMNGLEATTEIRKSEDEAIRNTPVFALTADVTSGTKQMLLNNGINM